MSTQTRLVSNPAPNLVPSTRYKALSDDSVEIFAPNHVGFFTLTLPVPEGMKLLSASFTLTFIAHEDLDCAGFALNDPPNPRGLFGISQRNKTFRAKHSEVPSPFGVELLTPYEFLLKRGAPDSSAGLLERGGSDESFRLTVNGRHFTSIPGPVPHLGIFAWEAHVRFERIRFMFG